tara:strand:+ start:98 stop:316 length:219 start_codon:yes stop_codon:yes gene_type:complete
MDCVRINREGVVMVNSDLLRSIGFGTEANRVNEKKCPFCGKDVANGTFKDEVSRKEFNISGLCQSCQDRTFG